MKYTKSMKKMLKTGMMMGVGHTALSSLPANDISPKVSEGMTKFAGFYPTYGSMAGVGMTLGITKKVLKSTKLK